MKRTIKSIISLTIAAVLCLSAAPWGSASRQPVDEGGQINGGAGAGGSGENEGDRGIDASRPVQPPQQSCASCLRATSMLIYRQTLFVDVELCRRRVSQLNY